MVGVRYIAHQRRLTNYQLPLVAAAYNAGGLHPPRFGDACAVAAEDGWQHMDKAA